MELINGKTSESSIQVKAARALRAGTAYRPPQLEALSDMSSEIILQRVLLVLAVLLMLPCYLSVISLFAFISAGDSEGLVAIFLISLYSFVLWLPLSIYWIIYKSRMSSIVRWLSIAPVFFLATISGTAVALW